MSRVLVTGSAGFIGRLVMDLLVDEGHTAIGFDYPDDVLAPTGLDHIQADAAIHLAAEKHAPQGEECPEQTATLNIQGTANVCRKVPKVVLASTCKAAAPITCYGASKLIAERVVLNAGGVVVRLVNVVGSSGSVTEIWDAVPDGSPLPVTEASRMFMAPELAARLLVRGLNLEPGRYAPRPPEPTPLWHLAHQLHPDRPIVPVPLRRGDRPVERLLNDYETSVPYDDELVRVVDYWEPVEVGSVTRALVG